MPKEKLFFDYGGLIANYDFTPQTLLRAHNLALQTLHSAGRGDIGVEELSRAHNRAIRAYLGARKDGSEWHMDKIMGLVLSNLAINGSVPVQEVSRIYKLNDHDIGLKGNVKEVLDELQNLNKEHIRDFSIRIPQSDTDSTRIIKFYLRLLVLPT
ncbi:MAG: hypothetical protein NUV97_04365 [archaeon]|nr:hypothetical protein [archaeon]